MVSTKKTEGEKKKFKKSLFVRKTVKHSSLHGSEASGPRASKLMGPWKEGQPGLIRKDSIGSLSAFSPKAGGAGTPRKTIASKFGKVPQSKFQMNNDTPSNDKSPSHIDRISNFSGDEEDLDEENTRLQESYRNTEVIQPV
jgi:hypothetical protein